jgi:hypothetical protein
MVLLEWACQCVTPCWIGPPVEKAQGSRLQQLRGQIDHPERWRDERDASSLGPVAGAQALAGSGGRGHVEAEPTG